MNRTTRTTLAALMGLAALLGTATPAAATGSYNDQAPGTSSSSLTEYVSFKEAPVFTAVAPSGYLRTEGPYIIDDLGDGYVRYFQASEPFTGPDRTKWRAVNRYWESENGDYEAMFVPEESIADVLTTDEYWAHIEESNAASQKEREERLENFQASGFLFGDAPYYASDDTAAGPAGTVGYPTPLMSMSNPYEANGETWHIASSNEFGEDLYYVLASDVDEFTPYAAESTPSSSPTLTAGYGPQAPPVVAAPQSESVEESSLSTILGIIAGILFIGALAAWAVIARTKKKDAEHPGKNGEIPGGN